MFRHSLTVCRSFFSCAVHTPICGDFVALLYQRGDFIFCFLPDGGKLPAVRDVIFENEFRLLDSSIQLADILTHSVAYVPWLFRQCAHLV